MDPIYIVIFVLAVVFVVLLLKRVSPSREGMLLPGPQRSKEDLMQILEDAASRAGEDIESFFHYLKEKGIDLVKEMKDEDGYGGGWRHWRRRPWRRPGWWIAPYVTFDGPYIYRL